jgi:hypothetical protein
MRDNRETIEMLKILKRQALKSHNDTAVLEVKIDSFNFVLDEAIEALEGNVKLKEAVEKMDRWIHSGNRYIVDHVEEIINELKKDGMVSE